MIAVTGRHWLFTWLPEPTPDFGWPEASLAEQLAAARAELRTALRKQASLARQLEHWIDQAIRARAERDQAEAALGHSGACLGAAVDRNVDLTRRVLALEEELRDITRSADNLMDIAEGAELRELRAGLAVGALRKGKR